MENKNIENENIENNIEDNDIEENNIEENNIEENIEENNIENEFKFKTKEEYKNLSYQEKNNYKREREDNASPKEKRALNDGWSVEETFAGKNPDGSDKTWITADEFNKRGEEFTAIKNERLNKQIADSQRQNEVLTAKLELLLENQEKSKIEKISIQKQKLEKKLEEAKDDLDIEQVLLLDKQIRELESNNPVEIKKPLEQKQSTGLKKNSLPLSTQEFLNENPMLDPYNQADFNEALYKEAGRISTKYIQEGRPEDRKLYDDVLKDLKTEYPSFFPSENVKTKANSTIRSSRGGASFSNSNATVATVQNLTKEEKIYYKQYSDASFPTERILKILTGVRTSKLNEKNK